jgi:multidrug efflux pump subunit AcrB
VNDFNNYKRTSSESPKLKLYIKAYNHKIVPVILTVLSTVIGLLPFIWNGQKEVFWFSFAAGVIGGLFFSCIAIYIYFPLFLKLNIRQKNT